MRMLGRWGQSGQSYELQCWSPRLVCRGWLIPSICACVCLYTVLCCVCLYTVLCMSIMQLDTKIKPSFHNSTGIMLIKAKIFLCIACEHWVCAYSSVYSLWGTQRQGQWHSDKAVRLSRRRELFSPGSNDHWCSLDQAVLAVYNN